MTDKELVERLREKADLCLAYDLTAAADAIERLQNEAEGMRSNWSKSVITIKRLKSELTQEKIENTNLIGELATVAAERDRYKAERENPQPSTNADRIRAMDDKAISVLLSAVKFRRECFIKIPDFLSIQDAYKWLQQPAEEADHESNSEP